MGTWRSKVVRLDAKKNTEIYFEKNPSMPNMVYINNPSGSPIYVSLNRTPDALNHDRAIMPYDGDIIARPFVFERIIIFNSGDDIDVTLYYDFGNFNFEMLKSKTESYITGVKKGLYLPTRNNYGSRFYSGVGIKNIHYDVQIYCIKYIKNNDTKTNYIMINGSQLIMSAGAVITDVYMDIKSVHTEDDNQHGTFDYVFIGD